MSDTPYTGLRYDEMPSLWDGFANLVRPGLGLTAFGANVMNLPPDYETKAHDESGSGQEELYVALAGSGAVLIGEERERVALDPESAVRVAPGTSRAGQRARRDARAHRRRRPGAGLRRPGVVERRGRLARERVVLRVGHLPGRERQPVREVVHRGDLDHVPRVGVGEPVAAQLVELGLRALERRRA